ncbi:MAG TPA: hypothetical protein VEJ87_02435, partial [Acidimicrobiales bacterium]|nr:hypothetical protein [Acidimicrobiales bacterium]
GGFSDVFARPKYQLGVVPVGSPPGRGIPDISMFAGDVLSGMLVGITQNFNGVLQWGVQRDGGTSLSTQLVAATDALASQEAGERFGFINPTLYDLARKGTAGAFIDVTGAPAPTAAVIPAYVNPLQPSLGIDYFLITFGFDRGLTAVPGWDDATGIGTPGPQFTSLLAAAR